MRILMKYTGVFVAGFLLVVVLLPIATDHLSAQIVPVLRIYPLSVRPGASVTATFSGRDYSDSVYFDVRFRQPESNVEQVALNWQRGPSATHSIPAATTAGTWVITAYRAHEDANDHAAPFVSLLISDPLTVIAGAGPDVFTATGSMTVPRNGHTATLLPNGKVLIAGGENIEYGRSETVWARAELYDPSTGTFSATGNMTSPRLMHTATLLPNGKVLIAGGTAGGSDNFKGLASAEIYDPASGTFMPASSMTTARAWHSATLLVDGRVLIAGGLEENFGSFKNSGELYDPSSDAFTSAGVMTTFRLAHTATLLVNGQVLLDGTHNDAPFVDHSDLYDPRTNTFNPTGTLSPDLNPIAADTATLLMNGNVLVIRTDDRGSFAFRYDASNGTLAPVGFVGNRSRSQQTATLLPDGTILIAGGDFVGEALLYDPATRRFSSAGYMDIFRRGHTATLLPDGTVLITGGSETPPFSLTSALLYKPALLMPAPVLRSVAGDGRGQGEILHAGTNQIASAANPAGAGDTLKIFCIGLVDGSVIPPQITIGGRMAEILDFGKAPGFEGLNQVNVRVPAGVAPGPAVPVRLTYLARPSNEVTIGVR